MLFPVSAKGVLVRDGRVLLLRNERAEWELPGGKLELGEEPHECVAREIAEETGLPVSTGPVLSHEHQQIGFFSLAEVGGLTMPAGYKQSIQSWFARLAAGA